MKRIFNKEKCIEDLKNLNPAVCEMSKGWIEMCDGREVINGIVLGNKGEEYLVSTDWTDVVDDEKITFDKQNNEKPVTKTVFSRDLYIEDMDKCVPDVDHSKTGWAMDCDGAEVIDGYVQGKKGATYVIDDEWTKKVPVEENEEPAYKEVFSKELIMRDFGKDKGNSPWVIDCDGAEVIDGHAFGKSGKKYIINPDWIKRVPVEEKKTPVTDDWLREELKKEVKKKTKKNPDTKQIFSKEAYLATGDTYFKWIDDCDGAEVIDGIAFGKSGIEYFICPEWVKEVPINTVPVKTVPTYKKIFSKDKYLKHGGCYYRWIDDCDGAEVINGAAIGKSGKTFYITDDWTVEVPVTTDSYKIEIKCNDNKTTTATLYKNGEKVNEAIAKCSDRDSFDLFKGATLALDRLLL